MLVVYVVQVACSRSSLFNNVDASDIIDALFLHTNGSNHHSKCPVPLELRWHRTSPDIRIHVPQSETLVQLLSMIDRELFLGINFEELFLAHALQGSGRGRCERAER